MRNAPKFSFIEMPTATLGQLFISAVRYTLRSDNKYLIESVCELLRYCYLTDALPIPMCDVIIEDIRRRHEFFRDVSGSARYDDIWLRLLWVLTEPPDIHCARRGASDGKIVSIRQNELVMLLSAALNYALGRHTMIVNEANSWIRDFAPKLHHNDRASLASDIRCYLEKDRLDERAYDEESWRDALAFLKSLDRVVASPKRKPRLR